MLRCLHGPDWSEGVRIVYAGDDDTDEPAFRVLAGLGLTFRIGSAAQPTAAMRRLPSIEALAGMLEWLVRREELVPA